MKSCFRFRSYCLALQSKAGRSRLPQWYAAGGVNDCEWVEYGAGTVLPLNPLQGLELSLCRWNTDPLECMIRSGVLKPSLAKKGKTAESRDASKDLNGAGYEPGPYPKG